MTTREKYFLSENIQRGIRYESKVHIQKKNTGAKFN
jgi:hypothetical protein